MLLVVMTQPILFCSLIFFERVQFSSTATYFVMSVFIDIYIFHKLDIFTAELITQIHVELNGTGNLQMCVSKI